MREEGNGFGYVKLMIIILIISVLFVVMVPFMKGSDDEEKWAEGKATACTIRMAADNFRREKGTNFDYSRIKISDLGFNVTPGQAGGDLDGKYFSDDCFSIKFSRNSTYIITIDATKSLTGDPPQKPKKMTLNSQGQFSVAR